MATRIVALVTLEDVSEIMGILTIGVDVVVHYRRATTNRTYNMQLLEENLHNLPIGEEFKKTFLIFAYAAILALIFKLERMHDLWDTIWDSDVVVQKNQVKFVLQFLEDGIKDYHNSHPTYIKGHMLFLQVDPINLHNVAKPKGMQYQIQTY